MIISSFKKKVVVAKSQNSKGIKTNYLSLGTKGIPIADPEQKAPS